MTNNDRENFHEGTRQNEKERDSNMISHNIQKYQRQKGPEWDVCQRKAKGTTKEKSIPNKVIIVIPPKFESNAHVSHARAKAQSAAAS